MNSVTGAPFPEVVRGTSPLLMPLVIALLLITYVPVISLGLPQLLGFV